jgi:hypothetical protein
MGILGYKGERPLPLSMFNDPPAMNRLYHGGHADETTDVIDYMPKPSIQDNAFSKAGSSVDEKHVLESEVLGSRAQRLFADDSEHANSLERGNSDGRQED